MTVLAEALLCHLPTPVLAVRPGSNAELGTTGAAPRPDRRRGGRRGQRGGTEDRRPLRTAATVFDEVWYGRPATAEQDATMAPYRRRGTPGATGGGPADRCRG